MIGRVIKFKFPIESKKLQDAYDVIQLTEPHEAGINMKFTRKL